MTAAGFPTETAASQCPGTNPRPALPGDQEAWRSGRPLARPPVWSPGTASSKQGGLHLKSSIIKHLYIFLNTASHSEKFTTSLHRNSNHKLDNQFMTENVYMHIHEE
eukprot:XP_017455864.1 PREDICTED: uncharacterized protein LOC100912904 isoform X1 [Rattus norvegicus]